MTKRTTTSSSVVAVDSKGVVLLGRFAIVLKILTLVTSLAWRRAWLRRIDITLLLDISIRTSQHYTQMPKSGCPGTLWEDLSVLCWGWRMVYQPPPFKLFRTLYPRIDWDCLSLQEWIRIAQGSGITPEHTILARTPIPSSWVPVMALPLLVPMQATLWRALVILEGNVFGTL
jgi:hypothetical protein